MSANLQQQIVTRPILFSGPMVRALLDGSKTQTRRIAKDLNEWHAEENPIDKCSVIDGVAHCDVQVFVDDVITFEFPCRYGRIGDRLWVRETWMPFDDDHRIGDCKYAYRASTSSDGEDIRKEYVRLGRKYQWRPSIHMPRAASRLTLEITDIRVERLNAITPEDAVKEGIAEWATEKKLNGYWTTAFSRLWESINGEGSWAQNPWVWVVEFKVV